MPGIVPDSKERLSGRLRGHPIAVKKGKRTNVGIIELFNDGGDRALTSSLLTGPAEKAGADAP